MQNVVSHAGIAIIINRIISQFLGRFMLYQLIFVVSGYSRRGLLVFLTLALAACGGGGGSDSGNGSNSTAPSSEPERPRIDVPLEFLDEDYAIFISDKEVSGRQNLFIIREDGNPQEISQIDLTSLPEGQTGSVEYAEISPTRQVVAYVGDVAVNDRCDLSITRATDGASDVVSVFFNKPSGVTDFSFSNDGRRIAYVLYGNTESRACRANSSVARDSSFETQIYTIQSNGELSQAVLSTRFNTRNSFQDLAFSSQDRYVAFVSEESAQVGADSFLGVFEDGSAERPLIEIRNAIVPGLNSGADPFELDVIKALWSPVQDNRIAFIANIRQPGRETKRGLFTVVVSTTDINPNPTLLSVFPDNNNQGPVDFIWQPGGSQIAYISDEINTFEDYDIFIVDSQGGSPANLTENLGSVAYFDIDYTNLAWSPNNNFIAFLSDSANSGRFDLYTVNTISSADPVNITASYGMDFTDRFDVFPNYQWSPDGTNLSFTANGLDQEIFDVYVESAQGGLSNSTTPVSLAETTRNTDDAIAPVWSFDNRSIFYLAGLVGANSVLQLDLYQATAIPSAAATNDETRLSGPRTPSGRSVECIAVAGVNNVCSRQAELSRPPQL